MRSAYWTAILIFSFASACGPSGDDGGLTVDQSIVKSRDLSLLPVDMATADDLTLPPADLTMPPMSDMVMPADMLDPCVAARGLPGWVIARYAGTAPVIDGKLNDDAWKVASDLTLTSDGQPPLSIGAWPGSQAARDITLSGETWTAWDQDYLYVAFLITDNALVGKPKGAPPWDADAVELYFDGDASGTDSYDASDRQIVIPYDVANDPVGNYCGKGAPCKGAPWTVTAKELDRDSGGWRLEARIKWTDIGGSGSVGRVIGFDVRLDDRDSAMSRERSLLWYANPGTTSDDAGVIDVTSHPSAFGRLVLCGAPTDGGQ